MPDPYWRTRFGFTLENDRRETPKERNARLRELHDDVTGFMRAFLEKHPDPENAAERSALWTPIPWICHRFQISQAHLSRLFRELTGLNPIQTYDKIKLLETLIPLKYINLIKEFLHSPSAPLCQLETRNEKPETRYSGNGSKHFWTWLKAQRQNPDFDRQALAREFGFPSASRLHRAFYFAADLTPREFENTIIRQAIDAPAEFEKTIARFKPKAPPPQPPESSPNERMVPREPKLYYPPLVHEIDRITAYMRSRGSYADYTPIFNLPRARYQPQKYSIVPYRKPKQPDPEPIIDAEFEILDTCTCRTGLRPVHPSTKSQMDGPEPRPTNPRSNVHA